MTDIPPLTIAYMERLPEAAARTIAGLSRTDGAALFEAVPIRILTPVVERMEKWPAALCLQHLSAERAAAIVAEASYQTATVLLRLIPAERRDPILEHLPSTLARDLRQSLQYPRNTVGAWMDLTVPTLSRGATIEEASAVVRAAGGLLGDPIFVVDETQHLAGILRMESLVRHAGSARVSDVMAAAPVPLFARTLLRDATVLATWDDYLCLPVVSRLGQMLGTLTRGDLKQGMAALSPISDEAGADGSILSEVGGALLASMTGLLDLVGGDGDRRGPGGN
ncbi:magnesium transporter MgtE N-terminal domain-containing protein [Reyranella sp.]|uniref:magnesium transporter MgtE N-terminal domain-containing protein n=1 Tax=Reyranella sp. TaxID=1929291 RepID=UPI003BAD7CDD